MIPSIAITYTCTRLVIIRPVKAALLIFILNLTSNSPIDAR